MQTKMLIDEELVAGNGEALPVLNPATGETVAGIACSEVLGPVVTPSRFSEAGVALRIANAGRFGLASSVYALDADTSVRHMMVAH